MPVKLNLTPGPPMKGGPFDIKSRVIFTPSSERSVPLSEHLLEPTSKDPNDVETEEDGYRAEAIRRAQVLHRVRSNRK